MGERVRAGDLGIWTEQVGEGPDVLLIGGAGDIVESWQFQLDGYPAATARLPSTTPGRGGRRCPNVPSPWRWMADDAAGVLRALDIRSAHVAGFSGAVLSRPMAWMSNG